MKVTIWVITGILFVACTASVAEQKLDELIRHAQVGDVERVRALLDDGADPNTIRPGDASSLLILSAKGGHIGVVRTLIARGADVNLPNRNGWTPLMAAVSHGHGSVVKLLLENGADPNRTHAYGWTALKLTIQKGDKAMAELLRKYGAKK